MAEDPLVRMTVEGEVATIVLDNPRKRNALSRRLLVELDALLIDAADNYGVRCVVLTGADPVFCSGADLKEQQDGNPPGPVSLAGVMMKIMTHRCPVVARVNGSSRAGGLGLLAACDIAIGRQSSTFGFSEVRIGVVPAIISVPVLERIPLAVAREYFLTGRTFDGMFAEKIGLLNQAVADEQLDDALGACVTELLLGGPSALTETKKLLRTATVQELTDRFDELLDLSMRMFSSGEGQEGISSFREKRAAAWAVGES
jgi:methylglutaconyl-CoA hydratase